MKKTQKKFKIIFLIILVFGLFNLLIWKWIFPPVTLTQFGSVLNGHTLQTSHVPIEEISIYLTLAVIAAEDQLFAGHSGFDTNRIKQAIEHNKKGGTIQGGSTITQQTAKNVFLWQSRTWFRKGAEAVLSPTIEVLWGKKRILELYLNIAQMGPGIFGAQVASRHYFNKDAKDLTLREATLLASILPSPEKRKPSADCIKTSKKAKWLVSQMNYLWQRPQTRALLKQIYGTEAEMSFK